MTGQQKFEVTAKGGTARNEKRNHCMTRHGRANVEKRMAATQSGAEIEHSTSEAGIRPFCRSTNITSFYRSSVNTRSYRFQTWPSHFYASSPVMVRYMYHKAWTSMDSLWGIREFYLPCGDTTNAIFCCTEYFPISTWIYMFFILYDHGSFYREL